MIADPFVLLGGDARRIFVMAKGTGVFAIDKQTKVKTLATPIGPMTAGVAVGTNELYLVEPKQLLRVPLP